MAKRKKRKYNNSGEITSTMLYRAMMQKKHRNSQKPKLQNSGPIPPSILGAETPNYVTAPDSPYTFNSNVGGGGYSTPSGIAYDGAGGVDTAMTATNIENIEGLAADGGSGGAGPYKMAGEVAQVGGEILEDHSKGGKRGRLGFGKAAGNTLGRMGKGAATGAAAGALVGGGVLSVPAAAIGAVGGALWGLVSGIGANISKDQKMKKAFEADQLSQAQTNDSEVLAIDSQNRENQRGIKNNINNQDFQSINAFDEDQPTPMGSEGPVYRNFSGDASIMQKYTAGMNNLNKDFRMNLGMTPQQKKQRALTIGFGGEMQPNITGTPTYGVGGSLNYPITDNLNATLGIGGSPTSRDGNIRGFQGGANLGLNYQLPKGGQIGIESGYGGETGQYGNRGFSMPKAKVSIPFDQGGKVHFQNGHYYENSGKCLSCPDKYDESGKVTPKDEVGTQLNSIASGYFGPLTKDEKKRGWAKPIGPDTEVKEPGVYQMHGPSHEEEGDGTKYNPGGGSPATLPTPEGPQEVILDNKELFEVEETVGGLETMTYNNNERGDDGDAFEAIQGNLEKTKTELQLLVELYPEFMEEYKKLGIT